MLLEILKILNTHTITVIVRGKVRECANDTKTKTNAEQFALHFFRLLFGTINIRRKILARTDREARTRFYE